MTDWDQIENDWRFGDLSNVKLAEKHGVSEGAIRKRAKAEGWQKGVEPGPRQPIPDRSERDRLGGARDDDGEPAGDDAQAEPLNATLALALRMMDELKAVTSHIGEIEDLIYSETEDDRDARRRTAMLRAVSLKTRTETLKTIQQAILAASTEGEADKGKKAQQAAAAQKVASKSRRFAPPPPPRLVVNNT